jgi:hypothetical protein
MIRQTATFSRVRGAPGFQCRSLLAKTALMILEDEDVG